MASSLALTSSYLTSCNNLGERCIFPQPKLRVVKTYTGCGSKDPDILDFCLEGSDSVTCRLNPRHEAPGIRRFRVCWDVVVNIKLDIRIVNRYNSFKIPELFEERPVTDYADIAIR